MRIETLADDLDDVEGLAEAVEPDGGVDTLLPLLPPSLWVLQPTGLARPPETIHFVLNQTFLGAKVETNLQVKGWKIIINYQNETYMCLLGLLLWLYRGFTEGVVWGCYRDVMGVLQVCYRGFHMGVIGMLQKCLRGVTWRLQGCYRGIIWVLQGFYRGLSYLGPSGAALPYHCSTPRVTCYIAL